MVTQTINATYTETYDINTAIGELSLLGIHTPTATNLKNQFKGFFQQYAKVKVKSCDIALACASQQALDPSQMGLQAGQVDPRDVMNPILFKACTGERLNVLLDQIYSRNNGQSAATDMGSLRQVWDNNANSLEAYYTLLSDDSFRKTHPQNGLVVHGLKPLVRKIVTTGVFGNQGSGTDSSDGSPALKDNAIAGFGSPATDVTTKIEAPTAIPNIFMTNGTTELPGIDTTYPFGSSNITRQQLIGNIPRVYCGVIVLPPAIVQRLFFRMTIRWHISFYEFRPSMDIATMTDSTDSTISTIAGLASPAKYGYYELYHNALPEGSKMTADYASFTTDETTEVTKIMEKGS